MNIDINKSLLDKVQDDDDIPNDKFSYLDVKNSIKEFEKILNSYDGLTPQFEEIMKELRYKYKIIMGDF